MAPAVVAAAPACRGWTPPSPWQTKIGRGGGAGSFSSLGSTRPSSGPVRRRAVVAVWRATRPTRECALCRRLGAAATAAVLGAHRRDWLRAADVQAMAAAALNAARVPVGYWGVPLRRPAAADPHVGARVDAPGRRPRLGGRRPSGRPPRPPRPPRWGSAGRRTRGAPAAAGGLPATGDVEPALDAVRRWPAAMPPPPPS